MKDTIIKAKTKKRELLVFAICLGIAFILNIVSIIIYNTHWTEIFTMLHVVLLIAVVFYGLVGIIRSLIGFGKKLVSS